MYSVHFSREKKVKDSQKFPEKKTTHRIKNVIWSFFSFSLSFEKYASKVFTLSLQSQARPIRRLYIYYILIPSHIHTHARVCIYMHTCSDELVFILCVFCSLIAIVVFIACASKCKEHATLRMLIVRIEVLHHANIGVHIPKSKNQTKKINQQDGKCMRT